MTPNLPRNRWDLYVCLKCGEGHTDRPICKDERISHGPIIKVPVGPVGEKSHA